MFINSARALGGDVLLFVSGVSAPVAVGFGDGVDGGAFFAGGMGRMRRVREAGSGLACVVVELHQAEDQVRGHQLKRVGGIGYDIPAGGGTRLSPPGPTKDDVPSVETQTESIPTVWYTGSDC